MPSHSKLTCKKIFRGLLRVIPFRCPSVASRNPFAPFLDPVHVPHVRSFWLSWTPYEDPRGSCGNILRNSLLIPYFTVDRPSRILRSDFTYPVRRTGISPFLALRSWPFFEQEHWACGKTTGQATHQHISHLHDQVPQVLVIAQLTLSPPVFYVYRRLGAALLQLNFPLEAFLSLGAVLSSPAFYVYRASSAVWVPLFFSYSAFSLSCYCLHLFRFAGMPLPPVNVRIRLEVWREVVFSFVAFLMLFPAVLISCSRIALQTLHIL